MSRRKPEDPTNPTEKDVLSMKNASANITEIIKKKTRTKLKNIEASTIASKINDDLSEYQHQCKIIEWARMMAYTGQEPRLALLHGDSSGVRVPIGCALKMKRAGAIKGWPDIFLPITTANYAALFIELKRRKGGIVSDEQYRVHYLLRDQGYYVEVCKGADAAIRTIKWYLGIGG
jgi:hypothetical protein